MPKKATYKQRSMVHDFPGLYTNGTRSWEDKQQATLDKLTHPEWGVMKEEEFRPLTHKHQNDLEDLHRNGQFIQDFYFWQANLGGYCMADMVQSKLINTTLNTNNNNPQSTEVLVSSEGAFPLVRRIVDGAPHPGRKRKKRSD
ncbi:uncharacterized protein RHIMIDRAFT_247220 [Rhizopus microsporus ATCC 52813]|uniref:Uncharacterized protein n=1 Tax=Rhizopus microsporus ATCC 52813 TaxID=1340429 RepID=A0A2G4T6T7_RHIZD|nr:uncharacterized protein RHIMIDRAFT_247220 [Rhizopus microsporus ATCC 52813]PHZ16735.1 hypothetical protein RHIMIDRAFT_247220 [Rhizopus microsporus ATCC 52813]